MTSPQSGEQVQARAIDFLRELVFIESPSRDRQASLRIAELISERFTAIGCEVRLISTESGTHVRIDAAGPGTPLLLVGHTDTVWPVGTIDSTVPWSDDGVRITGPGVYDMKSGIVVMHEALSRLAGTAHRNVQIILTCDEEIGSPTALTLLRELSSQVVGAIGFESPHPDGALKVGRMGSSRVRLSVTGKAAHAALDPGLGVSAIDELVDQLLRVREITSAPSLESPVLCNVGAVHGGTLTNVVPDAASADIGLRFSELATEERVLAELRGLSAVRAGAELTVELLSHRPAWLADASDHTLMSEVSHAAASMSPDAPQSVDGRPAAGAGDTNLLGALGLPTIDGFGPRGGGAHATSEHILVASLFERIELLTALLAAPST